MTAAQLQTLDPASADELLRPTRPGPLRGAGRMGHSPADARAIAQARRVDIIEVVGTAAARLPGASRAPDSRLA